MTVSSCQGMGRKGAMTQGTAFTRVAIEATATPFVRKRFSGKPLPHALTQVKMVQP
jgi:hypothetical protein